MSLVKHTHNNNNNNGEWILYILGTYIECKHPYPHAIREYDEYHKVTCHFLYGNNDSDEEEASAIDKNKVGLSVRAQLSNV